MYHYHSKVKVFEHNLNKRPTCIPEKKSWREEGKGKGAKSFLDLFLLPQHFWRGVNQNNL